MGANLRFYNLSGQEININNGFNFGTGRRGIPQTIKFKIRNNGDLTARDALLASAPYNNKDEVTEEEYNNQMWASQWKKYSLHEEGPYTSMLSIGDIGPGKYFSGTKMIESPFRTGGSNWDEAWISQGTATYQDENYLFEKENLEDLSRNAGRRITALSVEATEVFHFKFNASFDYDTSEFNDSDFPGRIFVPVRINANRDGLGYMFILVHNRNNNRFYVSVNKGTPGIKTFYETNLGSKIFETGEQVLDFKKDIEFKVYTDLNGNPNFEVLYDGKNLSLSSASGSSNIGIDNDPRGYRSKGDFYLDILLGAGDRSVTISSPRMVVDEQEKILYMQSTIDNAGVNEVNYKSATILSYFED